MLGFDGSGKTTILYKMKLNITVNNIPTLGINVETFQYKNLEFTCSDFGGGGLIHRNWHFYYKETQGLIYVVDSNDRLMIEENRD